MRYLRRHVQRIEERARCATQRSVPTLRLLRLGLLGILIALLLWPDIARAEVTVDDVAKEIICQCGCTMIVSTCDCGTADTMRKEIREMLSQGKTKEQILAYYVEKYGEVVLAAPTKQGFNLTAWITPFAAIAGGGGVVYLVLRAWIRRRGGVASVQGEDLAEESPDQLSEYEDRLRRELEEMERE